ncbi:ras-related protein Rab-31-like [Anneissia japonica]|uniref:ras-related protein Rab-31-like n=1 Tax=Anneissia japonica TaxID=1529436 RepID=UPI0014259EED|nr:ras-related protein Rab-31-like [Anneissia japonica]
MKLLEAKVVVLGQQGVGKTSIVVRYVGKIFSNAVAPTIGASYFTFKMTVDNYRVKLQLWDTAGQERFRSMAPMYYRKTNAAFLVYDVTSYASFENIKTWVEELKMNVDSDIVMCVLGNKCDLKDARKVPKHEALNYAASIGALFFETSAMTNEGIQEAFLRMSLTLISLCETSPHCGLTIKPYDDRRRSEDIPALPANLRLALEKKAQEAIAEQDYESEKNSCCKTS